MTRIISYVYSPLKECFRECFLQALSFLTNQVVRRLWQLVRLDTKEVFWPWPKALRGGNGEGCSTVSLFPTQPTIGSEAEEHRGIVVHSKCARKQRSNSA